jgi:hypothetical protein
MFLYYEQGNKMDVILIKEFLEILGDDIHDMICDNGVDDDHRGLDSDRDSEDEVETAIRLFPEVLSRRGGIFNECPVQYISFLRHEDSIRRCNVKAASFIPPLARLTVELCLFEEEKRTGLLCKDDVSGRNVFQNLMCIGHTERFHDKCLEVLIKLRQMGLLKKEDIQEYCVLNTLCCQFYYCLEKRFRFLVE